MRIFVAIITLVLLISIIGCQTVQVYEGPRLPRSEVSRIQAASESLWQTITFVAPELLSVDYTPRGNVIYEVEPGIHRVIVFVGKPGNMGSQVESIFFETEPGRTYKVYGKFGEEFRVEDDIGTIVPLFWIVYG